MNRGASIRVFDEKIVHGFETDAFMSHALCAYKGCKRVLFWIDNGCADAGEDFKPLQCEGSCRAKNMCCSRHMKRYKCERCARRRKK